MDGQCPMSRLVKALDDWLAECDCLPNAYALMPDGDDTFADAVRAAARAVNANDQMRAALEELIAEHETRSAEFEADHPGTFGLPETGGIEQARAALAAAEGADLDGAAAIADRLWPIGGDPTFAQSRQESDGWQAAYDGAVAGMRDAESGKVADEDQGESSVWWHAYRAGVAVVS